MKPQFEQNDLQNEIHRLSKENYDLQITINDLQDKLAKAEDNNFTLGIIVDDVIKHIKKCCKNSVVSCNYCTSALYNVYETLTGKKWGE